MRLQKTNTYTAPENGCSCLHKGVRCDAKDVPINIFGNLVKAQTLQQKKYSINVIAIQQDNDVTTEIDPNKPLEQTMKLIVVANRNKLEKMR